MRNTAPTLRSARSPWIAKLTSVSSSPAAWSDLRFSKTCCVLRNFSSLPACASSKCSSFSELATLRNFAAMDLISASLWLSAEPSSSKYQYIHSIVE